MSEDGKMLDDRTQKRLQHAIRRVEGQARGIARMVGERRYCVDILTQVAAAEAALHRIAEDVLRVHLETCVMEAFRSGSKAEARKKIEELREVYSRCTTR
jgi:DNA-binding FrmR family transcriptional regulator